MRHGPVETIEVPGKLIKPRRFDVIVALKGVTWRRIQVEVSPDEGGAGTDGEPVTPPALSALGLPTPDHLAGIAMRYQIGQKVHAATDLHKPPDYINDRARDAVDLLLLRDLARESGHPSLSDVRAAIQDVFAARFAEAALAGRVPRQWPARLVAHPHWRASFDKAAASAALSLTLEEVVAEVNAWLDAVSAA